MTNTWKVIWTDPATQKRRLKRFETTSEAVAYAKELRQETEEVFVVSAAHAYPIPTWDKKRNRRHPKAERPSSRHLWCPYCIEWRIFTISAVRFDGIRSPEARRCPVCTISIEDFFVKKFNHTLGVVDDEKLYKGIVTMRRA